MTPEELFFFEPMPQLLPIYVKLRECLSARHPEMEAKVTKTQISLRGRYVFAMVSLPLRRGRGWPREYLLVSFGLGEERKSPRILAASEPYPGRWTHHVPVTGLEAVDGELLGWLEEAWAFACAKGRRASCKKTGFVAE